MAKQDDPRQPQGADKPAETGRPAGALPPPTQPGSGTGRVDVTGIVPEDIRIAPDITEGHPGYEESGDSELFPMPPEDLAKGKGAGGDNKTA